MIPCQQTILNSIWDPSIRRRSTIHQQNLLRNFMSQLYLFRPPPSTHLIFRTGTRQFPINQQELRCILREHDDTGWDGGWLVATAGQKHTIVKRGELWILLHFVSSRPRRSSRGMPGVVVESSRIPAGFYCPPLPLAKVERIYFGAREHRTAPRRDSTGVDHRGAASSIDRFDFLINY